MFTNIYKKKELITHICTLSKHFYDERNLNTILYKIGNRYKVGCLSAFIAFEIMLFCRFLFS